MKIHKNYLPDFIIVALIILSALILSVLILAFCGVHSSGRILDSSVVLRTNFTKTLFGALYPAVNFVKVGIPFILVTQSINVLLLFLVQIYQEIMRAPYKKRLGSLTKSIYENSKYLNSNIDALFGYKGLVPVASQILLIRKIIDSYHFDSKIKLEYEKVRREHILNEALEISAHLPDDLAASYRSIIGFVDKSASMVHHRILRESLFMVSNLILDSFDRDEFVCDSAIDSIRDNLGNMMQLIDRIQNYNMQIDLHVKERKQKEIEAKSDVLSNILQGILKDLSHSQSVFNENINQDKVKNKTA